ncbi:methyltransferase domain-containing protein [Corticibacter populi]|nr:methyltransferase domain-containing protein [Corticibacter populi]RZS31996.1 putative TPR repeat methyltransferase [Corticibacter populi]
MTLTRKSHDPIAPLIEAAQQQLADRQLTGAAQTLAQAHRLAPRDARVHLAQALLHEAAGYLPQAHAAMEQTVALSPSWWMARLAQASLLSRHADHAGAMQQARIVLQMAPNDGYALTSLLDMAHAAADLPFAIELLERLLARQGIQPQPQPQLQLLLALAWDQTHLGRTADALQTWARLSQLAPQAPQPRWARLHLLRQAGDRQGLQAELAALHSLAPDDPVVAHYTQWLAGQTPPTLPQVWLQWLGDAEAAHDDVRMQLRQGYALPRSLAAHLQTLFPQRRFDLLDLGCGTGLLGQHLGRIEGRCHGIDIAPAMLQQASGRQVYDSLEQAEALDGLRAIGARQFDCVAALQLFPFIGDLQPCLAQAARVLRPGGLLFFSIETGAQDIAGLQPGGRYVHQPQQVLGLLRQAGFAHVRLRRQTLLRHRHAGQGDAVRGALVTAQMPV